MTLESSIMPRDPAGAISVAVTFNANLGWPMDDIDAGNHYRQDLINAINSVAPALARH